LAVIETTDLCYAYRRGADVLRGVSLRIGPGERVAIMGENGAGKTTLIKHFNGLLKPTRGEVTVDGVRTTDVSVAQLSRKVGIVFQKPENQFFAETIEEEVAFGLRNFGFKEEEALRRVEEALSFASLDRYRGRSPFLLSGGEKKRLAIASVMAWDPEVMLIDEPTIGQDQSQKTRMASFLKDLSSRGKTVVLVTHDVDFAAETCKRLILLSRGVVIGDGGAEGIFSNISLMREASLLPPSLSEILRGLGVEDIAPGTLGVEGAVKLIAEAVEGDDGVRRI
jgi:energy-coupling factor transport system ATP-binding protein